MKEKLLVLICSISGVIITHICNKGAKSLRIINNIERGQETLGWPVSCYLFHSSNFIFLS